MYVACVRVLSGGITTVLSRRDLNPMSACRTASGGHNRRYVNAKKPSCSSVARESLINIESFRRSRIMPCCVIVAQWLNMFLRLVKFLIVARTY